MDSKKYADAREEYDHAKDFFRELAERDGPTANVVKWANEVIATADAAISELETVAVPLERIAASLEVIAADVQFQHNLHWAPGPTRNPRPER